MACVRRRLTNLIREVSLLVLDSSDANKWVCDLEPTSRVQCPPNSHPAPRDEIRHGCASLNMTCPGRWCMCKPCTPGDKINVFIATPSGRSGLSVFWLSWIKLFVRATLEFLHSGLQAANGAGKQDFDLSEQFMRTDTQLLRSSR